MVRFHDHIHERTPYDPRRLAKCITTNGGQTNYHPSGLRNFSPRERARLQTFRNAYRFTGTVGEVNRQVGNAVPPAVWRGFMGSVAQCLRDFAHGRIDAAGAPRPARPLPAPRPRIPSAQLWHGWLAALADDDRRRAGAFALPPPAGLARAVAAAGERAEREARAARAAPATPPPRPSPPPAGDGSPGSSALATDGGSGLSTPTTAASSAAGARRGGRRRAADAPGPGAPPPPMWARAMRAPAMPGTRPAGQSRSLSATTPRTPTIAGAEPEVFIVGVDWVVRDDDAVVILE
jgi:hypothetical protein